MVLVGETSDAEEMEHEHGACAEENKNTDHQHGRNELFPLVFSLDVPLGLDDHVHIMHAIHVGLLERDHRFFVFQFRYGMDDFRFHLSELERELLDERVLFAYDGLQCPEDLVLCLSGIIADARDNHRLGCDDLIIRLDSSALHLGDIILMQHDHLAITFGADLAGVDISVDCPCRDADHFGGVFSGKGENHKVREI